MKELSFYQDTNCVSASFLWMQCVLWGFTSYAAIPGKGETGNQLRGWPGPSLVKCPG